MSKAFLEKLLAEEIIELSKLSDEFKNGNVVEEHQVNVSIDRIKSEIYSRIPDHKKTAELDAIVTKNAVDMAEDAFKYYSSKSNVTLAGTKAKFVAIITYKSTLFKVGNLASREYAISTKQLEKDLNSYVEDIEAKPIRVNLRPFNRTIKTKVTPIEVTLSKHDTAKRTVFRSEIKGIPSTLREEYQLALEKALFALNTRMDAATWQGSDSREDAETKRIIEAFESSIKPARNVRKTKTNTTVRRGNSRASKTITPKVKRTKQDSLVKEFKVKGRKKSAKSAISLKALLNKKLPETLLANMKFPRLVYRTGRFARSVRVLNVATTEKGNITVDYTYMKYPYQTFEPGYAQGSVNRDPRRLIDRSIKDIAQELLTARFFTRRL